MLTKQAQQEIYRHFYNLGAQASMHKTASVTGKLKKYLPEIAGTGVGLGTTAALFHGGLGAGIKDLLDESAKIDFINQLLSSYKGFDPSALKGAEKRVSDVLETVDKGIIADYFGRPAKGIGNLAYVTAPGAMASVLPALKAGGLGGLGAVAGLNNAMLTQGLMKKMRTANKFKKALKPLDFIRDGLKG